MESLLGKTLEELQIVVQSVGLQKFAGKQLAEWLYVRRVSSFDEMTNISLRGREALKAQYTVGRHAPVAHAESQDGTRKYLFQIGDQYVESVYIPDGDRATLCVSTQMGCKMGCRFCMTGTLGFHGQLPAAEILNQILSFPLTSENPSHQPLPADHSFVPLTNIVYMGEGEPMDNIDAVLRSLQVMTAPWGCAWSPRRITVSSVGVISGLKRFLDESECHLAISLHNPFSIERQQVMPVEKLYPLCDVLALLKQYDWQHQRRVSFEYICWAGINDTPKHANELLRLLRNLNCRINLIRFHAGVEQVSHADHPLTFPASNERQMEWMRDYLTEHGLTTTIRRSRGEDILAACGMLVNALKNGDTNHFSKETK
ncbi:MAG: 23S rRNA (adenine(2503)-C(2))-methyltransferase RlmN [Bacteroidales bacterium]|nr:23S rRNA (adenine(2503)-C(2))-methyltransferase RlmN [Bacteroidales bacterium]